MDDHAQGVGETLIPADLKEQRPCESVRTVTNETESRLDDGWMLMKSPTC